MKRGNRKELVLPELHQKSRLLAILIVSLIVLSAIYVKVIFTERILQSPEGGLAEAVRLIDDNGAFKNVKISIVSSTNAVAVQEIITGENCGNISYYLDKETDIFVFNKEAVIWIIGNKINPVVVDLHYSVPSNCEISEIEGRIYALSEEFLNSSEVENIYAPAAAGGNAGGSTGGGGGGNALRIINNTALSQQIVSSDIAQAKDESDLADILGGTSDTQWTGIWEGVTLIYPLIILGAIVILVVLIAIILVSRKLQSRNINRKNTPEKKISEYIKRYKNSYSLAYLRQKVMSAGYTSGQFDRAAMTVRISEIGGKP